MHKSFLPEIKRKSSVYYLEDVDINYSFAMLEKLAIELGANIEEGDILVADNPNKDRRKIFRKVGKGGVILYLHASKGNLFFPLHDKGRGKVANGNLLKYLLFN